MKSNLKYTARFTTVLLAFITLVSINGCSNNFTPSSSSNIVAKTSGDKLIENVQKLTAQDVFEEMNPIERDAIKAYKQELNVAIVEKNNTKVATTLKLIANVYDRKSTLLQANGKQQLANQAKSISLQLAKLKL
jgi:intergrase/recombinase